MEQASSETPATPAGIRLNSLTRLSPQGFMLIGDEPDPLAGVQMNDAAAKVLRDAGLLDE